MVCLTNRAKSQVKNVFLLIMSILLILLIIGYVLVIVDFMILITISQFRPLSEFQANGLFYSGIATLPLIAFGIQQSIKWVYNAFEKC